MIGGFQEGDEGSLNALRRQSYSLGHCKIDRSLNHLEVVSGAGDVSSDIHQLFETKVVSRSWGNAEAIPRRTAVTAKYTLFNLFL
jgi:hypothetical protein